MTHKELFGAIAAILTFVLFAPYIRSIHRGGARPHVFSWVIWGLGTLIVFFAQLADGGGLGAWVIGLSGLISCYIAALSYLKRGDTTIARSDWLFFGAALLALPFWGATSDPLWAVATLTIADILGFGPTLRKAYDRPREESVFFFAAAGVRNALVIAALANYSLTTVLFPAAVGAACLLVAGLLVYRRRALASM